MDITGVQRTLEAARAATLQGKQGEVSVQTQQKVFAREMDERSLSVTETSETSGRKIESDSGGAGGGPWQQGAKKEGKGKDKPASKAKHLTKGKILDIRGA